jgi:hypothetical protein
MINIRFLRARGIGAPLPVAAGFDEVAVEAETLTAGS